jgi:tRNA threonylcarbamoyladenosine biosynthesis protein TsaE
MILRSPEETRELGRRLGALLRPGDFVALFGELGAGKTLLVRGAVQGAGATDPASSPSFALVNLYRGGRVPLQHLDLYRLAGAAELFALGFEDLLAEPAAILCEWAERAGDALPADRLEIRLDAIASEQRRATLTARGARAAELLRDLEAGAPEP